MYTVVQLSRIYKVSRRTIYRYLESSELQDYVTTVDNVLQLKQEGLQVLNVLLGNSKVTIKAHEENSIDVTSVMQSQIEELKKDKERLILQNKELQDKLDIQIEKLNTNMQILITGQTETKKSFWKRLFK